jgi:PAS domain S-box-containing protein
MLKVAAAHCDVRAAVSRLAEEILNPPAATPDVWMALEHLRGRLSAVDVRLWLYDGARAYCALSSGARSPRSATSIDLADAAAILQRLRHNGTVLCRFGDVSGLEPLVPSGVQSFAAAAAKRRDIVTAVLVVGWTEPAPPFDDAAAAHLRVAAALLASALKGFAWPSEHAALSDAVLDSLAERVTVLDRHGVVSAMNAAAREFARDHGALVPCAAAAGVNYAEMCLQAASHEHPEAVSLADGIRAACNGGPTFTTVLPCSAGPDERWCLITVAPLHRVEGGAVVTHTDLSHPVVAGMARSMSGTQFQRLADTVPVPIWIVTPEGKLLYGNGRWAEACGGAIREGSEWTDAFHPDDRDRAVLEFHSGVTQAARIELELRLRTVDGTYCWTVCSAVPRFLPDGRIESYVGVCWDASAKRRAESNLAQIAGKLVAAQEAERSRIARELHDDVGQQVAVLTSRLASLAKAGKRSKQMLQEAYSTAQDIATAIHTLSHQLHPAKLRLLGLKRTMEALCRDESRGTGIEVTFTSRDVPRHVPEETALTLFRVAQEALHNALKHSGATAIEVELRASPVELTLLVTDNGTGMDPLAPRSTGLGLLTMRERVELAGGALAVMRARPRGTTVRASVPVSQGTVSVFPSQSDGAAPVPVAVRARRTRRAPGAAGPESTA